jgi:arylsulfatase A-like enzyme
MAPYCFVHDNSTVGIPSIEKEPYNPQQRKGLMTPGWDDRMVDIRFTEKAIDFIDTTVNQNADQPFFLYLTPSAPHRPCIAPDFVEGASQAGARGDMVALVDWMVGQIDEVLDRHGIADNTLIVVTSDNGARAVNYDGSDYGHKSNGQLRGQKADIWDGGHREPFVARWPNRIAPGTTNDALVCLSDLVATCADIVGFDLPTNSAQDSFSMLPLVTDNMSDEPRRQAVVHHSGDGMFSVRQGKWKLILGLGSGGFSEPKRAEPLPSGPAGQLYNMDDDLQETGNLWTSRPDIVERMTTLLHTYQEQGFSRPGARS